MPLFLNTSRKHIVNKEPAKLPSLKLVKLPPSTFPFPPQQPQEKGHDAKKENANKSGDIAEEKEAPIPSTQCSFFDLIAELKYLEDKYIEDDRMTLNEINF